MSYLNPLAALPKLGICITPLISMRDQAPARREPDLMRAVQTAEAAGADAIVLSFSERPSPQQRSDTETALRAMTQTHLAMPLTPAMIELADEVRPDAVYFTAIDSAECLTIADTTLQLIEQAVRQLTPQSIQLALSLDPFTAQLQAVADAGITAVEFQAKKFAHAQPGEQDAQFAALRNAILAAKRLGMTVHLGHGIDYHHIARLVTFGDIAQINVGHAIAARAISVGWETAVRDMKALIIRASSQPTSHAMVGVDG